MMIKILLADDQYLMLEGIKAVLKHEPEIEVVGTAQDGRSAIAQVKKLQPDLVLIDIEMPKMNGITATRYIRKHLPSTKVIVLTSHKNEEYITQALQAGASGYLLKNSLLRDLKQAIYALGRGYSLVESQVLTQAVTKIQTPNVIKYQEKIAYFKKHRKSIYKPAANQQSKQPLPITTRTSQVNDFGITRANLAPIFDDLDSNKILMTYHNLQAPSSPRFNRQRYLKRIAWLLVAIASFVLSVIIF
ncbi:MAG: response regulator transcription factor [Cyanobacteria bacterium P01_E01_bin.35]